MTDDRKITDEQLEKEIENGKTQKQIAYQYDYGYPSKTLSQRAKQLGYRSNSLFTLQDWGGATISLDSGTLEKAQELSGVDPIIVEQENRSGEVEEKKKLFKFNQVVNDPDEFDLRRGDIVLRLSDSAWRREQ